MIRFNIALCAAMLFSHSSLIHAGLATSASRIIYTEGEQERSLVLANINHYPIIAQTWVDEGAGYPDQSTAPFVVLPAVFKMYPQGIQALRIVYNGDPLPQDRESAYWLNLYEIPGKTQEHSGKLAENQARLDLAMNTQLKVFYRPKNLAPMDIQQIAAQLHFSVREGEGKQILICHNPTPYHVSFINLLLKQDEQTVHIQPEADMMVKPFMEKKYHLDSDIRLDSIYQIDFTLINDDGYTFNGKFFHKKL